MKSFKGLNRIVVVLLGIITFLAGIALSGIIGNRADSLLIYLLELLAPFQILISFIFILIGIVLLIFLFRWQLSRKAITYQIISDKPILSNIIENSENIQINGQPDVNTRLIVIKLWNSGNLAILPTDYYEPITFFFGEGTEIFSAEILEKVPRNLQASLTVEHEQVTLITSLLNSKDSISLKVLLSGSSVHITVKARISGIKQILPKRREFLQQPLKEKK